MHLCHLAVMPHHFCHQFRRKTVGSTLDVSTVTTVTALYSALHLIVCVVTSKRVPPPPPLSWHATCCKMAQPVEQWITDIPPVTRVWVIAAVGTSILVVSVVWLRFVQLLWTIQVVWE